MRVGVGGKDPVQQGRQCQHNNGDNASVMLALTSAQPWQRGQLSNYNVLLAALPVRTSQRN